MLKNPEICKNKTGINEYNFKHQHLRAKTFHNGGVRRKAKAAFARKKRNPK
jgi:hypothetical protein